MARKCDHVSSIDRDWLPVTSGILKPHPHCELCGSVKNVSSDKGKRIGYFVNALTEMKYFLERKGYRITQSQIRLIVKELEERGIDDVYSISFLTQKEIFVEVVRKYVRVSREFILSFLSDCD